MLYRQCPMRTTSRTKRFFLLLMAVGGLPYQNRQKWIITMDTTGTLNKDVKEFLEAVCKRDGFEPTTQNIVETVTEAKEVHRVIGGSHRWYDELEVVVKIDDKFILYDWFHVTGDNSIYDMGLAFNLSSVKFCEEYEVTVKKYRPIE